MRRIALILGMYVCMNTAVMFDFARCLNLLHIQYAVVVDCFYL